MNAVAMVVRCAQHQPFLHTANPETAPWSNYTGPCETCGEICSAAMFTPTECATCVIRRHLSTPRSVPAA